MSDLSMGRVAGDDHQVVRSVEIPARSMPETGESSDGPDTPITPNLQTQTLADDDSNRIPSFVFSRRSNGTVPTGWSTCSNESLFSITSGNTSFTRDQLNSMKSGDLSYCYDPTKDQLNWMKSFKVNQSSNFTHSSPLPDSPCKKKTATESIKQNGFSNEGLEVAETTGKVSWEEESQHRKNGVPQETQHQMDNVKSFAFPILTGNANKNESSARNAKNKEQQPGSYSPRTTPQITSDTGNETQKPQENPKQESPEETKENTDETPKSPKEAMKSHTTKVNKDGGLSKWFSCFSCCSSSS